FIGEYSATIAGSKGRKRSPRLSVPSSSGNTLQHRLLASQIAMSLFQSPLHRGILCNGYSAGGKALESAAFSPLFIREYSATRLDRARRRDAGIFQSPLHRGILCNKRRSLADKLKLQQSFSPLFIGEYSATPTNPREARNRTSFQSPLHRGILCNGAKAGRDHAAPGGFQSPLHRGILCNGSNAASGLIAGVGFQSPLHRGILCNAITGRERIDLLSFQSPLHRGILCNEAAQFELHRSPRPFSPLFIGEYSATISLRATAMRQRRSFSPLFIGEYSATLSCQCDACKRYIFQSPLHRGILCNQKRGSRRSGVGGALSVPSSSGNTLQRQPGFVIAKTRIVLSVPSSSGNTLQR